MSDSLSQQAKALENQFFHQLDEKLLAQVKENLAKQPKRDALSQLTNIKNVEVLDKLLASGIDAGTFAAMTFVPLAAVAWADGSIDTAERNAVLKAAENHGILPGKPGHLLLEKWLQHPPGPDLLQAWKSYILELRKVMDPQWISALQKEVLDQAEQIAEASGGLLGLVQTVSPAEKRKLAELAKTFAGG